MAKETYPCKCGGTLKFNYGVNNSMGAGQCNSCDFQTMHVRVDERGDIHSNTFLAEYGAGKQRHKTHNAR